MLYMPDLTENEIEAYRKNKITSRYIANSTNLVVIALFSVEVKDRDTLLVFEIVFDPCLYPEGEWKQRQEAYYRDNIINFLLIDSSSGVIKAMRSFNMPIKLREVWLKSWNRSYLVENYSEIYKKWKNRIDLTYSVDELWNDAKDSGVLGEYGKLTEKSFDLFQTIQLENGGNIEDGEENEIIKKAQLEGFVIKGKKYHSPLPKEIEKFYCYTRDGGHSIIAVVESEYVEGEVENGFLCPIPVKTFFKYKWKIKNEYLWSSVPYDKETGVETEDGDSEW